MKKQPVVGKDTEKWLLVDKHRKVIFLSDNMIDVIEEPTTTKAGHGSRMSSSTPACGPRP